MPDLWRRSSSSQNGSCRSSGFQLASPGGRASQPEQNSSPDIDSPRYSLDSDSRLNRKFYHATKFLLDRCVAAVALIVLSPILLIIAIAVMTSSEGPTFFRQLRIGRGGREFTMLKFRSMWSDAETRLVEAGLYELYVTSGHKLDAATEYRLTPVGRWLRRSSLDELPQLFNILRGDMSLVGPRPIERSQLDNYGDLAYCYLQVTPGLTGMWQVSGRSTIQFPERARIDHYYYHRRSIRMDLAILARTPLAVLSFEGAY